MYGRAPGDRARAWNVVERLRRWPNVLLRFVPSAVPVLGGLASGAALHYLAPAARGSGIPQVKAAYAGRSPPPRLRDALGKFLLSALQIGTGSSLGREGPTVHICAGIADLISIASQPHLEGIANAADVMRPPVTLRHDDDLRAAFEAMLAEGVRELPAVDAEGRIVGFVDETSIAHAYAKVRGRAPPG